MRIISAALAATFLAASAKADAPNVVTDILPVQSLVAKVMQGVGTPTQILPANVSPHGYALRPSEARALQNADVVFWVGPELTPMLGEALHTLAEGSLSVQLLHLNGTRELEFRENDFFLELSLGGADKHDHGDHGDHGDHDEHDDHEEHAEHEDHEDHNGHDDHGHEDAQADHDDHAEHDAHEGHDGHSHEGVDPHAWLDPENARFWVSAIALKLSEVDPENAATYRANAADLEAELAALSASIAEQMAPLAEHKFVLFHDAYQYFEARFGLTAAGALLDGDGVSPSAARLKSVRATLKAHEISCVFTEPQFDSKVITAIGDGLELHTEELDPLGAKLEVADYGQLIQTLANQFEACLSH